MERRGLDRPPLHDEDVGAGPFRDLVPVVQQDGLQGARGLGLLDGQDVVDEVAGLDGRVQRAGAVPAHRGHDHGHALGVGPLGQRLVGLDDDDARGARDAVEVVRDVAHAAAHHDADIGLGVAGPRQHGVHVAG